MNPIPPTWKTWNYDSVFELSSGETLPGFHLAYESWGELAEGGGNVVLVLHALSGLSRVVSREGEEEKGWWEDLFVPEAPLGYDRHLVICPNLLGGCYGSTGPISVHPETAQPYSADFPQLVLGDLIESIRLFLRGIGLGPDKTGPIQLIGGSMGGMIAMEWAAKYPAEVQRAISLGAPGRSFPQTIALRHVQRQAIMDDPNWNEGRYSPANPPQKGLSLARQIGMITYRSDEEFTQRFQRDVKDPDLHFSRGSYQVQSYLSYQGQKFVGRFDANTYLNYSRAMDLHDLTGDCESYEEGVLRIESPLELISFSSDILCPPYQVEEVRKILYEAGRPVRHTCIESIHGHDAFLIETEKINVALRDGLEYFKRK